MESENFILKKIKEQLETVRVDFDARKSDLDAVVDQFIDSVGSGLNQYVLENIKRESLKTLEEAESLSPERIEELHAKLADAIAPVAEDIVARLRENSEWYHEDVVFFDLNSKAWEIVKTVEGPANQVIAEFELKPINLRNWTWLSAEIDALITTRFPVVKKEFIDKRKQLKYLESRHEEETRMANVLNRLDTL